MQLPEPAKAKMAVVDDTKDSADSMAMLLRLEGDGILTANATPVPVNGRYGMWFAQVRNAPTIKDRMPVV